KLPRTPNETALETALAALFHVGGIHVDVAPTTSAQASYKITFAGAAAGLHFPQLQWVRTWVLSITGPLLAAPGYGDATVGANPTAADVQAALRQVYGVSAITVAAGATTGTFLVTVGGAYVGLDLGSLTGATAAPNSTLYPTLDATPTVKTTLDADGTTAP